MNKELAKIKAKYGLEYFESPEYLKWVRQQNIRTVMQALHGCRKNCKECREEEKEEECYA